jgi:hypothetical protein
MVEKDETEEMEKEKNPVMSLMAAAPPVLIYCLCR